MSVSSQKRLRVGFAGITSGMPYRFAVQLAGHFSRQVELSAAWDADPAIAARFAEDQHIPHACETLDRFCTLVDAAFCDARNCDNEVIVSRLLSSGIAVYVSKPLAHNLSSTENMLAAARRTGTALMSCSPFRYHPGLQDLARRVQSGEMGPLLTCSVIAVHEISGYLKGDSPGRGDQRWRFDLRIGGTPLVDLGIHAADMLVTVLGATACRVLARSVSRVYRQEQIKDTHAAVIEHENGALSTLTIVQAHEGYRHGVELIGRDDKAIVDCMDGANIYVETARRIVQCWRQNRSPIPAEQMHHSMAILEAARQSAETDQWVPVRPYPQG